MVVGGGLVAVVVVSLLSASSTAPSDPAETTPPADAEQPTSEAPAIEREAEDADRELEAKPAVDEATSAASDVSVGAAIFSGTVTGAALVAAIVLTTCAIFAPLLFGFSVATIVLAQAAPLLFVGVAAVVSTAAAAAFVPWWGSPLVGAAAVAAIGAGELITVATTFAVVFVVGEAYRNGIATPPTRSGYLLLVIGMTTLVAMQLPVTIIAATAAGLTAGMLSFVDDAGSDAIRFLHLDDIVAGGREQE